jgi:pimeloyl-ACP methyl ester carboxylesterase
MRALRVGRGQPVVLVHGALGDCRQWLPIAAALAKQAEVWSLSRRHHWPAPPPAADAEYTVESQAADLVEFLRTFDRPVDLVGHSYGGAVVQVAALAAPERVRRLVLIEAAHPSLLPAVIAGVEEEQQARQAMIAAVHGDLRTGAAEHAAIGLIDWVMGGPGGYDALPAETRRNLLDNAATLAPAYARQAAAVVPDALRALRVLTLVAHGANTRLYYRACAEGAVALLPDARLAVVPGAGHMLIVERPLEVAARLLSFLMERA